MGFAIKYLLVSLIFVGKGTRWYNEACSSSVADNSQSFGEPYSLHPTTSRVLSPATKIENMSVQQNAV